MSAVATVLVVEGDESTQRLLQQTLRSRYTVLTASCWAQAHEIRARAAVDAIVVDVTLGAGDQKGLDALCAEAGNTPFVLVAGSPDESPFAHTRERSPSLFTIRPVQLRELPHTLHDAIATGRVNQDPQARAPGEERAEILAESRGMRTVMELIGRAALRDTPVLLIGESGTGKELLARALHENSPRAPGPFVALNCRLFLRHSSKANSSGTRKARLPTLARTNPGCFGQLSAGRSFSMKSATWRRHCRASSCASAGEGSASSRGSWASADRRTDRYSHAS